MSGQLVQDELDQLSRRVDGAVIAPGDREYDEARAVWNAMIDRRPSAVVSAADVDDVVSTIGAAGTTWPATAPSTTGSCSTSGI